MKKYFLFFVLLALVFVHQSQKVSAQNQQAQWLWAQGLNSSKACTVSAMCHDSLGNMYVSGVFGGQQATIGSHQLSGHGGTDVFVAKISSVGSILWVVSFGGSANERAPAICCDADGHCIVAGSFSSPSIQLGNYTLQNANAGLDSTTDIFVVKLDSSNGGVKWAKSQEATGNESILCIAPHKGGGCIVGGEFNAAEYALSSSALLCKGGKDAFIALFASNGTCVNAFSCGGTADDQLCSIVEDASGNIFACGNFSSPTFDINQNHLVNKGASDAFVLKLNSQLAVSNVLTFGTAYADTCRVIKVNALGECMLGGSFYGPSLSINALSCSNPFPATREAFLAACDANLTPTQVRSMGGEGDDDLMCLQLDENMNAIVGINSRSTVFNVNGLPSAVGMNTDNMVFVQFDGNTNVPTVDAYKGNVDCLFKSSDGTLVVGGSYTQATLAFNNITLHSADSTLSSGFIASRSINYPSIDRSIVNDCLHNLVRNGSFESYTITSADPVKRDIIDLGVSVPNWSNAYLSGSPFLNREHSCDGNNSVTLYGTSNNGEAVKQYVHIEKGKDYEISLCAKWSPQPSNTLIPRISFRASNVALTDQKDTRYVVMATTDHLTSESWTPLSYVWHADNDYTIVNICTIADTIGNIYQACASIDNICIREVLPCPKVTVTQTDKACCLQQCSLTNMSGKAITSIEYTIHGAVLQTVSSTPCIPGPTSVRGAITGTLFYSPGCSANLNFIFDLSVITADGSADIELDVRYGDYGACHLVVPVHCDGAPATSSDRVVVVPGTTTKTDIVDSRTLHIFNESKPTSSIKAIRFQSNASLNTVSGSSLFVDGIAQQWSPASLSDLDLSQYAKADTAVQLTLSIPRSAQWSGVLTISIEHTNGSVTILQMPPWVVRPVERKSIMRVVNTTDHVQRLSFRCLNTDALRSASWLHVTLPENSGHFLAGSGQDWLGSTLVSGNALLDEYTQGATEVRFHFRQVLAPGDSSGLITLVASSTSTIPMQPRITLYDEGGNVMATDSATMTLSSVAENSGEQLMAPATSTINTSIYPNPGSAHVSVDFVNPHSGNVDVELVNELGAHVLWISRGVITEGPQTFHFETTDIPSGNYFIRVVCGEAQGYSAISIVH